MAGEQTALIDLDDTDLTVANPEEDVRGPTLSRALGEPTAAPDHAGR